MPWLKPPLSLWLILWPLQSLNTTVALSTTTPDGVIRYTLDGSTPNSTSTVYDGPILIDEDKTIKAITYKAGMNPSPILTAEYTIAE